MRYFVFFSCIEGDSEKAVGILKAKSGDQQFDVQLHALDKCGHDVGEMENIHEYHNILRRLVEDNLQ